jgi:hypothetical protein
MVEGRGERRMLDRRKEKILRERRCVKGMC